MQATQLGVSGARLSLDHAAIRCPLIWSRWVLVASFLHLLVSTWPERHLLWVTGGAAGANGEDFPVQNLWAPIQIVVSALADLPLDTLVVGSALFAALFAIIGGRVLASCFALSVLTIYSMNPIILDGGDNALRIAVMFLPLMVHLPVVRFSRTPHRSPSKGIVALHNATLGVLVVQVITIYSVAGAWKAVSPQWRSGDAMAIVLGTREFNYLNSQTIETLLSGVIGNVVTWVTVLLQVAVIVGLSLPVVRRWWIAGLMAMHFGIMLFLGLVTFGLIMIALDMVLLTLAEQTPTVSEAEFHGQELHRTKRLRERFVLGRFFLAGPIIGWPAVVWESTWTSHDFARGEGK